METVVKKWKQSKGKRGKADDCVELHVSFFQTLPSHHPLSVLIYSSPVDGCTISTLSSHRACLFEGASPTSEQKRSRWVGDQLVHSYSSHKPKHDKKKHDFYLGDGPHWARQCRQRTCDTSSKRTPGKRKSFAPWTLSVCPRPLSHWVWAHLIHG